MTRRANFAAWRKRHGEALREAQVRALDREARKIREAFAHSDGRAAVDVRWGSRSDESRIAELLELNGMPRWVAYEERFVVAEDGGEVMAAVRYRTEPGRLLLGLLVADPWRDGETLAAALYSGARALAWDAGIPTLVARVTGNPRGARTAGFRRRAWVLRAEATAGAAIPPVPPPKPPRPPAGSWRRALSLWRRSAVPFFRTEPDDAGR
jgi:hypothetical protein